MRRVPLVVITIPRLLVLAACTALGHVLGSRALPDRDYLTWQDVARQWEQYQDGAA